MKGIYVIRNKINNLVYVGQTTNFERRKKGHIKRFSTKDYKEYSKLYKAIEKYGLENFEFEFIEECNEEELLKREKQWIKHFNSFKNGYNSTIGGKTAIHYWKGKSRDIETRQKISKSLTGSRLAEETKRKIGLANSKAMIGNKNGNKKVVCVELNKVFNSLIEAAQFINRHPSGITKVLKGEKKTCGGYTWKYF